MNTRRDMQLLRNPILVFDGESFIQKDDYGKYISSGVMASLNKVSREYNMVAVFPPAGKYKAAIKKFINRGKEERIFPARSVFAGKDEVEFLLKKHGSPLISFGTPTGEYVLIGAEKRLPFTADFRDFRRLLMRYEIEQIPIEEHLKKPVDLKRAFLRREKSTRFEEKFK